MGPLLLLAWLALLACPPAEVLAQSTGRAAFTVVVTGRDDLPVPEASVRLLRETGTAVSDAVRTDRRGTVSFEDLIPGSYDVRVERVGYRPFLLQGVVIGPAPGLPVRVALTAEAPPVTRVDSARYGGGGTLRRSATRSVFLSPGDRERLPALHPSPIQGAEGAAADPSGASQGLPFWMGQWELDGVPFSPARHPWTGASVLGLAFPEASMAYLGIPEAGLDMGMPGVAAPGLVAQSLPVSGASMVSAQIRGWSSGLWSSEGFSSDVPSALSTTGSLIASFPAARAGDGLFVAVEGGRSELPRTLAPTASWGTLMQSVASGTESVERVRTYSALAHGTYGVGSDTDVEATLSLGGGSSTGYPLGGGQQLLGDTQRLDSRHGIFAARASHAIGSDLTVEGRLGLQASRVSHDPATDGFASVPTTRVVGDGGTVGMLPGGDSEVERRAVFASVSAAPRLPDLGVLRVGGQIRFTNFDFRHLFGSGGEFVLANATDPVPEGRFVQTAEPASFRGYSRLDAGLFGEYQATLLDGLDLGVGFRYDWESFDNPALLPDSVWPQLSGVAGSDFSVAEDRVLNGSLRLDWRPEGLPSTSFHGVVGVRHGETDPVLLNEVHRTASGVVRQTWDGAFPEWPNVTGAPTGEAVGLTLLGPGFARPRTLWALVGASRALGGEVSLTMSAGLRQTDFLPLRNDLNALPAPTATDQFGRPVFGVVEGRGAWMGPRIGSNRRFIAYDNVWAIDSDGWSHHVWGTLAMDARLPSVDMFGSLTLSQTEDNWLGAAVAHPEAGRDPRLGSNVVDWTAGTSDFDVPLRAVASATIHPASSLQLTATYRFHSGRPFTPGFREGVDANGDGSWLNDPAHVPDAQTLGDLGRSWSCLMDQSGQFAARNSCRGPSVQRIDAQAAFSLPFEHATLVVEALNLLDQGEEMVDGALWLLDGTPAFSGASTVQVPYVINPAFGQPLRRLGIGRLFRVGVQVDF